MTKLSTRDNFPSKTIRTLKARVASRCSNPKCRVVTAGPSGNDKENNIGTAAHITAASAGGPRYDETISAIQRRSIDNAIWLCNNCAGLIDRDVTTFTIEVLNEWKLSAENTAKKEIGKNLLNADEVNGILISTLTGFPLKDFLPTAIPNIHKASASALEKLDPRFTIKSSFNDGIQTFELEPRESVHCSVGFKDGEDKKYALAFKDLLEDGKDISLDMSSLSIKGSKLLEEIFETGAGKVNISSPKIKAIQKIWLINPKTHQIETFDDVIGEISSGSKSFSFVGRACNDIMDFVLQLKDTKLNTVKFVLGLDLEKWQNLPVSNLPYFEKILSLFTKACDGWEVHTSLEVNGEHLCTSKGINMSNFEFMQSYKNFLHYVKFCKVISLKLNQKVNFRSGYTITPEEILELYDVSEILLGKRIYEDSTKVNNLSCKLAAMGDPTNLDFLKSHNKSTILSFDQDDAHQLHLFGSQITLPTMRVTLEGVLPKYSVNLNDVKSGDEVEVEWIPQDNFKCTYEFVL